MRISFVISQGLFEVYGNGDILDFTKTFYFILHAWSFILLHILDFDTRVFRSGVLTERLIQIIIFVYSLLTNATARFLYNKGLFPLIFGQIIKSGPNHFVRSMLAYYICNLKIENVVRIWFFEFYLEELIKFYLFSTNFRQKETTGPLNINKI